MSINPLDFIAASLILIGLFGVKKNKNYWIIYGSGCLIWIYLSITVGFYFGAIMNVIAAIISVKNYKNG